MPPKGHNLQNHGQSLPSSKGSFLNSGSMDSFAVSLAKKCERLATAEYLVTSFLSDTEPLKARLRVLSLDLVRDASLVRFGTVVSELGAFETLRANISETLSLLELAFINGLISEMNFSILKREYIHLRDAIEIKKVSRESRSDTALGDNFFEGSSMTTISQPVPPPPSFPRPVVEGKEGGQRTTFSIGQSKGQAGTKHINMSDRKVAPIVPVTPPVKKQSATPTSSPSARIDVAREARQTRILKLVKDRREVAIKDIVEHFPELSEKTIQRELLSFITSGVLKKTGDRRWSRYSLA